MHWPWSSPPAPSPLRERLYTLVDAARSQNQALGKKLAELKAVIEAQEDNPDAG